jgi:serine/threonine protein kinase
MSGKSLDKVVHKNTKKTHEIHASMKFEKKVKLLMDVVKGMLYLHALEPAVIHRDLKSNVRFVTY